MPASVAQDDRRGPQHRRRALWRATGLTDEDFGRPIVAVGTPSWSSCPARAPADLGRLVGGRSARRAASSRVQTIAVDDGIAMGHTACSIRCPRAT